MRKLDHDQKRFEIAGIAARIIAEEGLEALTTRRLARAMESSIGAVTHYFGSKAAIVLAAFDWSNSRIAARLQDATGGEPRIEDLLPLIAATLPHDAQSRIEWRVRLSLWSHAATDADSARLLRDHTREYREAITGLARQLQQRGELRADRDPAAVAELLAELMHGMGFAALLGLQGPGYDPAAMFAALIEELRAPPATTRRRRSA